MATVADSMEGWIGNQIIEFLVLSAIAIGLAALTVYLVNWVAKRLLHGEEEETRNRMAKLLNWPIFILVFSYGTVNALVVLEGIPDWLYVMITVVYRLTFSIVVVYLVYRTYRSLIIPFSKDFAEKKGSKASKSFIPLMDIIGSMLIVVFGIMWILHYNGVDIMVFVAGLGIIGIILGIALQDSISNFFSGLWLMMDQPFSEGDVILYKEEYCKVLRTGFRSTRLYNILKHEYLVVPNNDLANKAIINKNEPDLNLRIEMDVGVEYGSDVAKTKEIILEAISAQPSIVKDDFKRKPVVNFKKFGNDSLEFRAWYYVREVLDQWRTAGLVQEEMDRRFREQGIVVAFPQRTISYRGDRGAGTDPVHMPPVSPSNPSGA
jgi:small-conductance mechanosensitive channel